MVNRPMGLAWTRKGWKRNLKITFLLGKKQRKHSVMFYLANFHAVDAPYSPRQRIATVVSELERPQTHPTLGLWEARAGSLQSGRNHIIIGEMHQRVPDGEKSPKCWLGFIVMLHLLGTPRLMAAKLASLLPLGLFLEREVTFRISLQALPRGWLDPQL